MLIHHAFFRRTRQQGSRLQDASLFRVVSKAAITLPPRTRPTTNSSGNCHQSRKQNCRPVCWLLQDQASAAAHDVKKRDQLATAARRSKSNVARIADGRTGGGGPSGGCDRPAAALLPGLVWPHSFDEVAPTLKPPLPAFPLYTFNVTPPTTSSARPVDQTIHHHHAAAAAAPPRTATGIGERAAAACSGLLERAEAWDGPCGDATSPTLVLVTTTTVIISPCFAPDVRNKREQVVPCYCPATQLLITVAHLPRRSAYLPRLEDHRQPLAALRLRIHPSVTSLL